MAWQKIDALVRKKEAEIQSLETELQAARAYLQALQDVSRVLPKGKEGTPAASSLGLRAGSSAALAREALLRNGAPMHVSELLRELGKEMTSENRASLTGALSAYVRKGVIFTRPAPNRFGLVGFAETRDRTATLPDDFGEIDM